MLLMDFQLQIIYRTASECFFTAAWIDLYTYNTQSAFGLYQQVSSLEATN